MKITVQTLGSSALNSIVFENDRAEVEFVSGGKYTYALNTNQSAEQLADELSNAPSVGSKFNQFVRQGVLVAA